MSSVLAKAISNTSPLQISIRRHDEHHAFATVTLAGKIEISSVRLKTKRGHTRIFWPTTPDNAKDKDGRPLRVFPIVRIIDNELRAWLELEILKAFGQSQPQKAQAQSA